VVVEVTSTVTVAPPLKEVRVKVPLAPAVPQVPVELLPPTEATVPAAVAARVNVGGGAMKTLVASMVVGSDVVVVEDTEDPSTNTSEPTHTSAKLAEGVPSSEKVVVEVTSTVTVVSPLNVVRVKVPVLPAVPQVPEALLPPTEATVPAAVAGRGGGGGAMKTLVASMVVGSDVVLDVVVVDAEVPDTKT
jgi:hypothetical protein